MRWSRAALLVALVTVVLYLAVLNYKVERWNQSLSPAYENQRSANDRQEEEESAAQTRLSPSVVEGGREAPLEVSKSPPAATPPKEAEPPVLLTSGNSDGEPPSSEPADVQGVTEQQAPENAGGEQAHVPVEQQDKWAPATPENITKAAVLCVPGPDEHIPAVVRNALENLPKDWKVQIFHGPNMTTELMESPELRLFWKQGRILLTPTLPADMTHSGYSQFLMTAEFWDQVCCEYTLMIQTDSIICSKSPSRIDDFTRYDYIGAPWDWSADLLGGNGGFSFRKRSVILESIKHCSTKVYHFQEDVFYALCFQHVNALFGHDTVKLAPIPVAKTFSVETIYYPTPYGLHKVWAWQNLTAVESLLAPCPDLLKILPPDFLEQIQASYRPTTDAADQLQLLPSPTVLPEVSQETKENEEVPNLA